MLRSSAAGGVNVGKTTLPHARINTASGRLSGSEIPCELLAASFSRSTHKSSRSPQYTAIPGYGSNRRSSSLQSPLPEACRELSNCLSADILPTFVSTKVKQAYSEVPEHNGCYLVLYVDKDTINQSTVTLMLESGHTNAKDFKVATAGCGREALAMIFSSRYLPDIVLMDTVLPDMKASQDCESLRASFSPVELIIMVVADCGGESDALAALGNGVNDFILKPLRQLELLARINSHIKVKSSLLSTMKREAESRSHYNLLVQVLPPKSIARLSIGQACAPEQHDQVTILFSDVVGFTDLCSRWSTHQVVSMLDNMFSGFDDLCDKHGAFRVETIGDAYMVASGHEGSQDHALRLAKMAVDMLESMQGLEERIGAPDRIRIGMHTGPALSGVVGKRRPRYCFFGDTVNTASRMESTGYPMTIQISDACRRSMLAAAEPRTTDADAAATVLRRTAPAMVPVADVYKSDFFMTTTIKVSRASNEAVSRILPLHAGGPAIDVKSTLDLWHDKAPLPSFVHTIEQRPAGLGPSTPTAATHAIVPNHRSCSTSSRHSSGSEITSKHTSIEFPRTDQQQAVATSSAGRLSLEDLSDRRSSRSTSQRSSLEVPRAGQQQAVTTSSVSRLSLEKLRHNSMAATAMPAQTTRNDLKADAGTHTWSSDLESDSSTESSDSTSSSQPVQRQLLCQGRIALKLPPGGTADDEALEAAAGVQSHSEVSEAFDVKAQGSADSWLTMPVPEEQLPGLPWSILNLGNRSVKGKGPMKTHLLKVGSWQQAVLAIKAEQMATQS